MKISNNIIIAIRITEGMNLMLIREDVLKLSFPIVTEQVFIVSMGIATTVLAGHIGKEAVSAIGMVDSINNIFIAFFSALAVGGTVVVAQYSGQDRKEEANEAAKQVLFSAIFLAGIIAMATWLLRYQIIRLLYGTAEQSVIVNADTYISITLLTYPLISFTSVAYGVLRGTGDTKTPMKITIFMNLLNIVLSYFLIYGFKIENSYFHLFIPGMKVRGAALGIAAARIVGALLLMYALLKGSKVIKLSNLKSFKLNVSLQKSIFGIGVPTSVELLLFYGGRLITQIFIVGMGTAAVASNYIASSVFSLMAVPSSALCTAATTLVGQNMGKGDHDEAQKIMFNMVILSSICMLVLSLFSFPLASVLSSIYTKDKEIIKLTARLIRMSAVCMPIFWSVAFLLPAGLKGAGDAKYAMITSVIGMWAFRITLGYILGVPLKLGVQGVWMGMYIDWVVRGILFYLRFKKGKWKNNIVIRNDLEISGFNQ